MKVQVLSVQPSIALNSHEVVLSVGGDRHKFMFTTEVDRLGEHLLQTTHGSRTFADFFRFNQRVAMNVTNLVVKCHNHQAVEFPADVGIFVTPEAALSKQKAFESGTFVETDSQQPEAINLETRQRAIAIVEKLPEAMLDEAVKFLESSSVKANLVE
ncbi:hypothetical protein QUB68_28745 [Microcoleus sp. A006_D1]